MRMSEITMFFSYTSPIDILCILLHTPNISLPVLSCNLHCWHFFYQLSSSVKHQTPVYIYIWLSGNKANRHTAARVTKTGIWGSCGHKMFTMRRWQHSQRRSDPAPNSEEHTGRRKHDWRQLEGGRDALALAELSQMHMDRPTLVYILPNSGNGDVRQLDM